MLLLFAFCSISHGQSGASASPAATRNPEEEAIHKAVDEIVAAIDHNDADALDRLSTPDYTFVNPAGKVWNKAQYLELIRSGALKVESYSRDEEIIRLYHDTAVVIYRSMPHGTFKGEELSAQRRVTTVLVKQDGRWLTAGRQSTPILQPK
ncbi:MAG: nuclear transport factor 2 family protein [Chthoniobacterales bacterium]